MTDPFGPARRWRSIVHGYYDRLVAAPGGGEPPTAETTPVPPADDEIVLDPTDDIGPAEVGNGDPAPSSAPGWIDIGPEELDFDLDPADDELIEVPLTRNDATR